MGPDIPDRCPEIAGVLGFGGVAAVSVEIAKVIFFIAIALFVIMLVANLIRGRGPPNPL